MMMISTSAVFTWITPTTLFCFLNLIIVTIFLISRRKKPDPHPQISRVDSLPAAATGPSSILQRVKSIDFSSFQRFNQYSHSASSVGVHDDSTVVVETSVAAAQVVETSATTITTKTTLRERKGKSGAAATTTSSRERCREDEEGVDEKADDFINRFRQQLKLQRLDSILRYKDMLNRGSGSR